MGSLITTALAVDAALIMDANYKFGPTDRRYIDDQMRGVQQHLVDCLIRGRHATYVRLSGASAALVAGDVVCLAAAANATEPTVTKAVAAALVNARSAFGIALAPGVPGGYVLVAYSGAVLPSITGLASGTASLVRVNTTTARAEFVVSIAAADYGLGSCDATGAMYVAPFLAPDADNTAAIAANTASIAALQTQDVALALASDFGSTTSTSAQNTNLTFAIGTNEVWEVDFGGEWSLASGTSGVKLAINGPAGVSIEGGVWADLAALTSLTTARLSSTSLSSAFNTVSATVEPFRGSVRVKTTGTGGNITLQIAPVAAVVATLKAGAWIRARKVTEV